MLEMEQISDGSNLLIKIIGVMDYSTINRFDVELPAGFSRMVMDFSELEFIDSTGIGAILTIIHKATDLHAEIEFAGLNETVKELFDTVGVFRILEALQRGC